MGYVRIKTIKGIPYGYWVVNTWTPKGPRQKVHSYLGKVFTPQKTIISPPLEPYETTLTTMGKEAALQQIITWELAQHGFTGTPPTHPDGYTFDLDSLSFIKKNKKHKLVLHINEGHLCNHTLTNLQHFTKQGFEREVATHLAHSFVAAGLSIPKALFITYFTTYLKDTVERGY